MQANHHKSWETIHLFIDWVSTVAAVVKLCQSFLFQSLANRFNSQNVHHLSSISINLSIQWASRIPQCLKITQEKQIKITNDITGKTRIIKDAKSIGIIAYDSKGRILRDFKKQFFEFFVTYVSSLFLMYRILWNYNPYSN